MSKYELISNELEMLRLKHDVANDIIKNAKTILKDDDINFTENLSNSFDVINNKDGTVSVISRSRYGHLVEWGTPPGKVVNFDALRYWVENKLGVSSEDSIQVTMKIMNKIETKGIKPTRFFKKAILRIGARGKGMGGNTRTPVKRSRILTIFKNITKTINKATKTIKNTTRIYKSVSKKR